MTIIVNGSLIINGPTLKCYTCTKKQSNSDCLIETQCSGSLRYCETIVTRTKQGFSVITNIWKYCSSRCMTSVQYNNGLKSTISCCDTALCNISGAMSVKISYLALVISVGFGGSLLRSGL
ncbi:lymphocyte antigen 6E-like [Microcaecilia unicolor]|uniref:Lymphocyte antigen 6E-like n=1 Tax=Microcaecilia unicolor TaxID=1415580 RepID=A0A6P7WXL4_9AMPH|nr:lymphocyte antigen 6E-like [Microcaecilia unicolor]